MVEDQKIVAGLQATDGIKGGLQQQHIPFAEHGLAEPLLHRLLTTAKGEHGGVMTLPEAQFPQAGTRQSGACRKQDLHCFLA